MTKGGLCLIVALIVVQGIFTVGCNKRFNENEPDEAASNEMQANKKRCSTVESRFCHQLRHGYYGNSRWLMKGYTADLSLPYQMVLLEGRLWIQTSNFEAFLFAKYALSACRLENGLRKQCAAIDVQILQQMEIVLDSLTGVSLESRPYYSLFHSRWHQTRTSMSEILPCYFLMLITAYALRGDSDVTLLRPIVQAVFNRVKVRFAGARWKFLRDTMIRLFKIEPNAKTERVTIYFDLSTTSFIYEQMKWGSNDAIREFFSTLWNTLCIIKTSTRAQGVDFDLETGFLLNTSHHLRSTFQMSARRLYQHQFLQLLVDEHASLAALLDRYWQLRKNFSNLGIDYRYRFLGTNDFCRLQDAFERLRRLLDGGIPNDVSIQRLTRFFSELFVYVSYKYTIFAIDLFKKMRSQFASWQATDVGNGKEVFARLFQDIKGINSGALQVYASLKGIRSAMHEIAEKLKQYKIDLPSPDFLYDCPIGGRPIFCLNDISSLLLEHTQLANDSHSDEKRQDIFAHFTMLEQDLGLLPNHLSRHQYTQLITDIELALDSEQGVSDWFTNNANELTGNFKLPAGIEYHSWPLACKQRFLKCFKAFLTLYNQ